MTDSVQEIDYKALAEHWQTCYLERQDHLKYWLDRAIKMEIAIRKHWHQKGHDRCWENDEELYKLLPEYSVHGAVDRRLPSKGEFLTRCAGYYESQTKGKALPIV